MSQPRSQPSSQSRTSVTGRLKQLLKDRSGGTAIMVGLAMPVLAGMGMLGVDAGVWYFERRDMQTAADAAAISAALQLAIGDRNGMTVVAHRDAGRNGFDVGAGTIVVENPPSQGPVAGNAAAVEVTLRRPLPLFYGRMVGTQNPTVEVRAAAQVLSDAEFCFLSLEREDPAAFEVYGNTQVTANCGIAVNSSDAEAMDARGSSLVDVSGINIVGGIGTSGRPEVRTDSPVRTGTSPVTDPYADLEAQEPAPCTQQRRNVRVRGTGNVLSPGTYCGGLTINSQSSVTLQPGVYVFDGGEVQVNGGATVVGDGVTMIFTGSGNDYAHFTLNGGSTLQITAPTSGEYAGVAMFGDPEAPDQINRINGGARVDIQGAVYMPTQQVVFTGNTELGARCMQWVARRLEFGGDAALANPVCENTGVRQITTNRVRLVR